ncbi:MAG: hypothetical protein KGH68_02915 [Patescibacteria group bacterium]|nr:hypothetical protein [Patescibacteria group bacterium]
MKALLRILLGIAGFVLANAAYADVGLLMNASLRCKVTSGTNVPIVGISVSGLGASTQQLLIRAMGPSLAQFGVPGAIQNSLLTLYQGQTVLDANADWSTDANSLAAAASTVGAFGFTKGLDDAAMLKSFTNGTYTAQFTPGAGVDGIGLLEVYSVSNVTSPHTSAGLANLSMRGPTGPGAAVFTMGFVIGNAPLPVLIRGIGPSLTQFGVPGAASDTTITLFEEYQGNTYALVPDGKGWFVWKLNSTLEPGEVTDDDWANGPTSNLVKAYGAALGAFALDPASKDAAIELTLPPGAYTLQIRSKNASADYADAVLGEIYDASAPLPPSVGQ